MAETPTVLTLVVVEETQFRKLEADAKAKAVWKEVAEGLDTDVDSAEEAVDKIGNVAHTLMIQRDAAVEARDLYRDAVQYRIQCVDDLHVEVESLKEDRDMWRRAYEEAVKRRPTISWTAPLAGAAPGPSLAFGTLVPVPNASATASFPNETATVDFEDRNRK